MDYFWPLATLWIVQLLAVISPGQSFVITSKLALTNGRASGVAAAFGMGLGTTLWSLAAIAGLALVLEKLTWLYALLQMAGGLYLVYLAIMIWRHSADIPKITSGVGVQMPLHQSLITGFLTQIANPKVAVFFGSIFFALLPGDAPLWVYGVSVLIVSLNEVAWYSIVALAFSIERSRRVYLNAKSGIDKVMAVVLGGIGAKLVFDGFHSA